MPPSVTPASGGEHRAPASMRPPGMGATGRGGGGRTAHRREGAALAALASASALAKSPPYTIGYDIYFAGNSWSVQLYEEFKAEVQRQGDVIRRVYYTESQGDSARQVANIEDLITRGVDAIIVTPISPTAVVPVLERAYRAGITVVLLGARANTDKYSALVTVDDYEFGRTGAEWLAKKLGGKGKIIALNGIAGTSVSEERWQGARDVFYRYPGIQVIASVRTRPGTTGNEPT